MYLVHPQYPRLWRVDYGRGHQRAVNPAIGNGKAAAHHFGHTQLAIHRLFAQRSDLLFKGRKAHCVGVFDHRHHKAGWRAHGHTHVDVVFVNDVGAVHFGVHLGHLKQRVTAGLGEKRHEAQFHPVFFQEQVFVFGPDRHDRGHVDFVIGGQLGCGVLALFKALGHCLFQTGHPHPLLPAGVVRGVRRPRGSQCRWRCGADHSGWQFGRRVGNRLQHILFHDPPVPACAFYLICVQIMLSHQFLC